MSTTAKPRRVPRPGPNAQDDLDREEPPRRDADFRQGAQDSHDSHAHDGNGELPKGVPLWSFGDHPPKLEDTLFGNRYLCRKAMALLVGPSGQGKSSMIL
jgi:hypothetical protein